MRPRRPLVLDSTKLPTIYNFKNLTGNRYGRLLVVKFLGTRKGRSYWSVICDCGNTTWATAPDLGVGQVRSCGCLQSEITIKRNKETIKHGESNHRNLQQTGEYRSWQAMKSRCFNTKARKYPAYGGAGITVDDRWIDSFENFLQDMGRRPSKGHTLDRWPDPAGNYEPGNCRWATALEQRHNRRPTKGDQ